MFKIAENGLITFASPVWISFSSAMIYLQCCSVRIAKKVVR